MCNTTHGCNTTRGMAQNQYKACIHKAVIMQLYSPLPNLKSESIDNIQSCLVLVDLIPTSGSVTPDLGPKSDIYGAVLFTLSMIAMTGIYQRKEEGRLQFETRQKIVTNVLYQHSVARK